MTSDLVSCLALVVKGKFFAYEQIVDYLSRPFSEGR